MRIRIANYMMAATALACVVMVYFGKQAAQRGDSVAKQNLEWHRQVNEEAKKQSAKIFVDTEQTVYYVCTQSTAFLFQS